MQDQVVETYKDIVADHDGIAVKGKKTAYTAVNGNMFSFVDGQGVMCLRLSADDKMAYESKYGTGDVIQHGSVMRGYVPMTTALLNDRATLATWFGKSVENARSLKPKATTRKK